MHLAFQKQLRTTLDQFEVLNDDEFANFLEVCKLQEFKKKDYLLRAGQVNRGIYFVLSGSIGLFEIVHGNEVYHNFFLPHDFANDLKSLSSEQPSSKNLIALADGACLYFQRNALRQLYEESISYERLGRKLLEYVLKNQIELSEVLQALKPKQRYQYILEHKPALLNAVSLTHLSSYLGIARETLSRIRAQQ